MASSKKDQGFHLLEVLFSLSIVIILSVTAEMTFNTCYYEIKTVLIANQLRQEIYLARNLALTQRQNITYQLGRNQRCILNAGGKVTHTFEPLPRHFHLQLKNSLAMNDKIIFTPLGFTRSQCGSFYLSSPTNVVRIVITLSGLVRLLHQ